MISPAEQRARQFEALSNTAFDLLVIGGGITGCGVARDAALRGLRVALVEKDDFASGTSSRSSRLIHGGVRYLEHGHLHLVFESSAERRRLLRIAPHLVRPLPFTWPVYAGARIPRWKLNTGLFLYDVLALFRNVGRHHRLSRDAVLDHEPALRTDGLLGGASYFDAATDDARLTLANAIGAAEAGAVVLNHAAVVEATTDDGSATGAIVEDRLALRRVSVSAATIVNATGPWGTAVRGSKGAHIAVPRDRIGNRAALTLLSPTDGRVFFALPAGPHAIIGTTDTYSAATPDHVHASSEDVRYLLNSANAFFPSAHLTPNDVVSAWAGIRPLVPTEGDTPGAASREHVIDADPHGIIWITGGKLTTYRVMARDVVRAVMARLKRREGQERTRSLPLPGGDIQSLDATIAQAARVTENPSLATHLARTYGSRWMDVWREIGAGDGRTTLEPNLPYTIGELRYSVTHEMASTLGDLLVRRTRVAFETHDHGLAIAGRVAKAVAPLLGWDEEGVRRAVADYSSEAERIFSIR
jgi:glycerol-3-phosphate dehydrogenase